MSFCQIHLLCNYDNTSYYIVCNYHLNTEKPLHQTSPPTTKRPGLAVSAILFPQLNKISRHLALALSTPIVLASALNLIPAITKIKTSFLLSFPPHSPYFISHYRRPLYLNVNSDNTDLLDPIRSRTRINSLTPSTKPFLGPLRQLTRSRLLSRPHQSRPPADTSVSHLSCRNQYRSVTEQPVIIHSREARASLLGGRAVKHPYQPCGGVHHQQNGSASSPPKNQRSRSIMYRPHSKWQWAFVLTALAQAVIVLAFEA